MYKRKLFLILFSSFILFILSLSIINALTSDINLKKLVYKTNEIIEGNITLFFYEEDLIHENTTLTITLKNKTDIINIISITLKSFIENSSNFNYNYTNGIYSYNNYSEKNYFTAKLSDLTNFASPSNKGNYEIILNITDNETEITSFFKYFLSNNENLEIIFFSPIGYISSTSTELKIATNNPAICRYKNEDIPYYQMDFLESNNNLTHLRLLTNLEDGENIYYISCKDFDSNEAKQKIILKVDNTPPIINLGSPADNAIINNRETTFYYISKDNSDIDNCKLYTNIYGKWEIESIKNNIENKIEQKFNIKMGVYDGTYKWMIECTDNAGNSQFSVQRNFNLILQEEEISSPQKTINIIKESQKNNSSDIEKKIDIREEIEENNIILSKIEDETINKTDTQNNNFITGFFIGEDTKKRTNFICAIITTIVMILIIIILSRYYNSKRKITKINKKNKIKKDSIKEKPKLKRLKKYFLYNFEREKEKIKKGTK